MRYLFVLIFALTASCTRKAHPASGTLPRETYKSTYDVSVVVKNADPQTRLMLPELYLEITWEVISDGNQSFVHAVPRETSGTIKITSDDELFAYTHCDKGLILQMNSHNVVQDVFRIRNCVFEQEDRNIVTVQATSYNTAVMRATDCNELSIQSSQALPASVNPGNCFLRDMGVSVLMLTGTQHEATVTAELSAYHRHVFDFSPYRELLKHYKDTTGLKEWYLLGQAE